MKKVLLPFLITVCAVRLSAVNLPDSLTDRLSQLKADSPRVDFLNQLTRNYVNQDTALALFCIKNAIREAKEAEYTEGLVQAYIYRGIMYYNKGSYQEANNTYRLAMDLSLGKNYQMGIALASHSLGNIWLRKGDYQKAISCFLKSIKVYEELNNGSKLATTYARLAAAHRKLGAFNKAKAYLRKSLDLGMEHRSAEVMANAFMGLGNLFVGDSAFDSAQMCYQKSIIYYKKAGDRKRTALALANMGGIATLKENYADALNSYNSALEIQVSLGNKYNQASLLNNVANVYNGRNQYAQAISCLGQSLHIAYEIGASQLLPYVYRTYYEVHKKKGDLRNALKYFALYDSISDLLSNEQKLKQISELEIQYETEKKEKELIIQKASIERKTAERNILMATSLLLVILLVMASFGFYQKKRNNKKLAYQKGLVEEREKEKMLLLRELHHRVKNNLQMISSLLNIQVLKLEDERAAGAVKEGQSRVEAMALIHRDLYLDDNATKINIKNYIKKLLDGLIISYEYARSSLSLDLDIEPVEVDADLAIPIGLMVNELICNSFKHGLPHVERPKLRISLKRNDGCLNLIIEDNGNGGHEFGQHPDRSNDSFGMNLISSLSHQINATVRFNQDTGFKAELIVPFEEKMLV